MRNKKRLYMWYEVQRLTEQGLNKSQIRLETGLDRATIRKYQELSEDKFHNWVQQRKRMPKKLRLYHDYVKKALELKPYLSSAQVEDRLKEHYEDFPKIDSKTVYNFVQAIRAQYNINKPKAEKHRDFQKLPEVEYGIEAQVDFGETWMQTTHGKRQKVYFYTIVLSRSRYKYVYLTTKPFTTKSTIKAQEKSFEYMGGIPRKIIYDQDSVFINDENLGTYKLTKEFSSYCSESNFEEVFCRKADPQSKGKVENVVKFIKQNFLRGRDFKNIETLNIQALEWLKRTGNGKRHQTTQLIPKEDFLEEQKSLLPLIKNNSNKGEALRRCTVRKDNTICYKTNYYSLPLGTYKNQSSSILMQIKGEKIVIYDTENKQICTHVLSIEKGKVIINNDHKREKSKTIESLEKSIFEFFGDTDITKAYFDLFQKNMSRYYRDNLHYLVKNIDDFSDEIKKETLIFCTENNVYNAKDLIEILNKKQRDINKEAIEIKEFARDKSYNDQVDFDIEKSDISKFDKLFA